MQEGLNLNVMISSANLIGILGLAVKVFLSKQPQKIEQPLEVRNAGSGFNPALCEQRHRTMEGQISDLYCKVHAARLESTEVKGALEALDKQVGSIDRKMDALLERGTRK